jgi:oxygen-independent coproporphyrinogen-3 oxidase
MHAYVEAMKKEVESAAPDLEESVVTAISIEGGSPGLAAPADLQSLLRTVRRSFHLADDVQISLQTMPGDYSRALVQKMQDCGVNHWIFGIQTADLKEHELLQRPYRFDALSMVHVAIQTFDLHARSFELLYGIPGQTTESWLHSLDMALRYEPEHLTLYPLLLERGTQLKQRCDRGELSPCSSSRKAEFYVLAKEKLEAAGYRPYTIYDFAKPGCENRYRKSQLEGVQQLGIGYGSASRIDRVCYTSGHSLQEYLEHSDEFSVLANQVIRPDEKSQFIREAMAGLTLLQGLSRKEMEKKYGSVCIPFWRERVPELIAEGLISETSGCLVLTPEGIAREELIWRALEA